MRFCFLHTNLKHVNKSSRNWTKSAFEWILIRETLILEVNKIIVPSIKKIERKRKTNSQTQNVKQTVKRLQKHLHLFTFLIYFFLALSLSRLLLFVTYDRFVWFCFVFFFLFLFASFILVHSFCQPYTQCTICK